MTWQHEINSFDERRNIIIPGDKEQTINFCARQFIDIANRAISEKGMCCVALSGGGTPNAIYAKISDAKLRSSIDWSRVLLFWSDERCVPPNDPESNYLMAMQAGLAKLPLLPENIFRMQGEIDPNESANFYESLILEHVPNQSFDLMMLGVGEDGHTASLFPKTHGLHVTERLVTANFIPQKHVWRLSLTFDCINSSQNITIYALGKNKADIVAKVLTAPYDPDLLPAQKVGTPDHKALWVADNESAQYLQKL